VKGLVFYRAARDLLLRNSPRLAGGQSLAAGANELAVDVARRLGLALDHSVLPIQGPPGTGKTFTGAHMICELVNYGKRVGITAVGHKVIRKLLDEVLLAASEMNVAGIICTHRNEGDGSACGDVREIGTNEEALRDLQGGSIKVLGGTPWLWSRAEFMDSFDVLFVDEAGQMSLANVLACAPAGRNLVLIALKKAVRKPQKVQYIRVLQQQGGGDIAFASEDGQLLPDQGVRLFRERGSLVKHRVNTLVQSPHTPAFNPAHFRIKFALERLIQRQQLAKVRPTQLSPQCGDNLLIRESLGKLDHPTQIFLCVAPTVVGHQLSRQCGDNLFPIGSPLAAQNFQVDPPADPPIEEGKRHIDGNGCLAARLFDQGTDLYRQLPGVSALQLQVLFRHPYPFTTLSRFSLPNGSWVNAVVWPQFNQPPNSAGFGARPTK
jgi:hypothetical protein